MIKDPIVEEVRRHRQEHADENENDLEKIIQSLRTRERHSKRKLLNPGPKSRLDKTGSKKSRLLTGRQKAVKGIQKLLADVLLDMDKNDEPIPS